MAKKYCIYSNEYIDENLMNKEHIIPKKLGGQLDFSILVDKKFNANLGSKIDAPFVENTYIKLISKKYNFTGHSKKVTPTFKDAVIKDTNEIVDISIKNNELHFYKKWQKNSPSWKKTLHECKAKQIKVNFNIEFNDYMRFFAKLFLSAGYYMYGDCFIENAFHHDLRKLMNSSNPAKLIENKKVKTRILCEIDNPDPFMRIVASDINAFKNYHVIWSSFASNGVVLGFSLFGDKMLSANCVISDNPSAFLVEGKGDVLLKEISKDSQRRLIKTTQEDVVMKFTQTFFPNDDFQ